MGSELQHRGYRLQRTSRVSPTATVRHFDQLSERAQDALVAAVDGGGDSLPATEFERGEVVVFTDYFRIQGG